jgi:2-polyprenyl-3-methyl-5-hydroxy-6-metoxy-1,4-benzoquinol methylase
MNPKVIENEIKWHTEHVVGTVEPIIISDEELNKYRFCRDWRFNPKQRLFKEMGNLTGKRVLDFGSGQGQNGVEMALLGADVIGFDIVPGLVEEAMRLAKLNGVETRCKFFIAEASSNDLGENLYDIVFIDNVLHHIPRKDREMVLEKVKRAAKVGGKVIIRAPIELAGIVSKIKTKFSIGVPITPDEHGLDRADVYIIKMKLGSCEIDYFGLLARLAKLSGRRTILGLAMKIDQMIFRLLPAIRRYAAVITIIWRKTTDPARA